MAVDEGVSYAYANVGPSLTSDDEGVVQAYSNVGPVLTSDGEGVAYRYSNIVTTAPSPVIYWLIPDFGREGWQFTAYGKGFGATQLEWAFQFKFVEDALVCSVVSWERVAETDYGSTREIDHDAQTMTIEYEKVVLQVPSGVTVGPATVRIE